MTSFSMHFEKCQCGLLREAFCSDGEGSSSCRREGGGVKGRVSVLENEIDWIFVSCLSLISIVCALGLI